MIKYFHKLTRDEWSEIIKSKGVQDYSWEDAAKDYPQPEWCKYPQAVQGVMGCWSLMDFRVTGRNFCKNCDCYIKKGVSNAK